MRENMTKFYEITNKIEANPNEYQSKGHTAGKHPCNSFEQMLEAKLNLFVGKRFRIEMIKWLRHFC